MIKKEWAHYRLVPILYLCKTDQKASNWFGRATTLTQPIWVTST